MILTLADQERLSAIEGRLSYCNLRRVHCCHKEIVRPRRHMERGLWNKIVEEVGGRAPNPHPGTESRAVKPPRRRGLSPMPESRPQLQRHAPGSLEQPGGGPGLAAPPLHLEPGWAQRGHVRAYSGRSEARARVCRGRGATGAKRAEQPALPRHHLSVLTDSWPRRM